MPNFTDRLQHAWNAFMNRDPTPRDYVGVASSFRPDRTYLRPSNERTIINSIYNTIAVDVAKLDIQHARLDQNGRFSEEIDDDLNKALQVEANVDQTGRAMIQDAVMSMLDEGVVAIVPVDTEFNPWQENSYKIYTLRVGKIIAWYPNMIKVRLYDERDGRHKDINCLKKFTAIVENPFYSVMNEPNSTAKRLSRNLNYLDMLNADNSTGKLDLIIQLPYTLKTDLRKQQAANRRKALEDQLSGSKLGIGYIDATEKITQINRPLENNLQAQIDALTKQLYAQLGISEEILAGTASEQQLLNYYNHTIEPIALAITEEMTRKFLTKTARTQGQAIWYHRDPFKSVAISSIGDLIDKLTRDEILTHNEIRGILGFKPSDDPNADVLNNPNMPHDSGGGSGQPFPTDDGSGQEDPTQLDDGSNQNGSEDEPL